VIPKPLASVTKQDIDELVANKVREGLTLEYKEALPGNSDSECKEFLADVCSFANSAGGDIVYGVSEARDTGEPPTGEPGEAVGLSRIIFDQEQLRLLSRIHDGIEPGIHGVQVHPVDGFPNGLVIVLRIPKSGNPPHMVTYKGLSRFFARTSGGKHQMDYDEIRAAFAMSAALADNINQLRDGRIQKIMNDETPVRLTRTPRVILHLIPFSAVSLGFRLDAARFAAHDRHLLPIQRSLKGTRSRFNLDGLLIYSSPDDKSEAWDYCQAFRSGMIEAVDAEMLMPPSKDGRKTFEARFLEDNVIESLKYYLSVWERLQVPLPGVVFLSLLWADGWEIDPGPTCSHPRVATPIDRSPITFPEAVINEFDIDVAAALRPVFDGLWNAAGWPRSPNYDDDGNRIPNPSGHAR
jgi:hypothetical protein